eukprot:scaffold279136_cov36-Tisochrysis_lutea.AAC.3
MPGAVVDPTKPRHVNGQATKGAARRGMHEQLYRRCGRRATCREKVPHSRCELVLPCDVRDEWCHHPESQRVGDNIQNTDSCESIVSIAWVAIGGYGGGTALSLRSRTAAGGGAPKASASASACARSCCSLATRASAVARILARSVMCRNLLTSCRFHISESA